jgi:hypothetical protein
MFKSNLYSTSKRSKVPIQEKRKNMAKVVAPFLIKGTIDDINFVVTANGNYARTKGKTGVTAEEFKIILFTTEFAIKEKNWTVRKKSGF